MKAPILADKSRKKRAQMQGPVHPQQAATPEAPFTAENVVAALHTLHNDAKFYAKADK